MINILTTIVDIQQVCLFVCVSFLLTNYVKEAYGLSDGTMP